MSERLIGSFEEPSEQHREEDHLIAAQVGLPFEGSIPQQLTQTTIQVTAASYSSMPALILYFTSIYVVHMCLYIQG